MTMKSGRLAAAVASTVSRLVSVRHSRPSGSSPSRCARIATWAADSSPVTYSALRSAAIAACDCSSSVDLPMPGSPPINTTEPGTRPPPSTRSSSLNPELKRGVSPVRTAPRRTTSADAEPVQPPRREPGRAVSPADSASAFQAPQSGHCPDHLGWLPPHSPQT